jgi:hypothetical protein
VAPPANRGVAAADETPQSTFGRMKLAIAGALFYSPFIKTAATAVRIVGNPTLQGVESDHEWSLQ